MTDLPALGPNVPGRMGVLAGIDGDELVLSLEPGPELLLHGRVRASAHVFLIDLIAGLRSNVGDGAWMLTNDLTLRALAIPAPRRIEARATAVRQGRRSAAWSVELTAADDLIAIGAAGFVVIARRDGDPPKPDTAPDAAIARLADNQSSLSAPLREEARIESIDARSGTVEVDVTSDLLNTNGTMQGAMVALVAECAAEDLVQTRFGVRAVVTDLDVRYLNRVEAGRVRATCRMLGDEPTAPIEIRLHHLDRDRSTTLVYARAAVVD